MNAGAWIDITHQRVGTFRMREDDVIHFEGLPGFSHARRFALLHHDAPSRFSWLACLDDLALAFPVADPRDFFASYDPAVPQRALDAVGARERSDIVVLAIANLRRDPPRLNLAAPIVLHPGLRRGIQAILEDEPRSTAEPIPVAPAAASSPSAAAQIESKPQT